ncbi:hypothetical protein Bbelb_188080 [Branchiostoma belcheri]|nr:hypothetical protein Bbelb_188080 [Branchiostoma belcheri]
MAPRLQKFHRTQELSTVPTHEYHKRPVQSYSLQSSVFKYWYCKLHRKSLQRPPFGANSGDLNTTPGAAIGLRDAQSRAVETALIFGLSVSYAPRNLFPNTSRPGSSGVQEHSDQI